MAWHGNGMSWDRMIWYGMTWYDIARYDMEQYGMVWHGTVWHGILLGYRPSDFFPSLYVGPLTFSNVAVFKTLADRVSLQSVRVTMSLII